MIDEPRVRTGRQLQVAASLPYTHAACLVTATLGSGMETTRRSLGRFLRRCLFPDTRALKACRFIEATLPLSQATPAEPLSTVIKRRGLFQ